MSTPPPSTFPTYAIAHGGGPWPWMKDRDSFDYTNLEAALAGIPAELPESPRAVLMVTAHWEAPVFTVQTSVSPGMLYDFGGFPKETYEVVYAAPGEPAVAARVVELLTAASIDVAADSERGFDHGTFVPAFVMYPEADIPIVQLSVRKDFVPAKHIELGRALAPLRKEGVLIIGSGLPSYHNLSMLGPASTEPARAFDSWLTDTMVGRTGPDRTARLLNWTNAPAARLAHPRDEHFLPLLVAVGAAEADDAVRNYHEPDSFGWTASSGYRLGAL